MSDLWQAYLDAWIRSTADHSILYAGPAPVAQLPWSADYCYGITAWNPRSHWLPMEENHRRQQQLFRQLHALTDKILPVESYAPNETWGEEMWLVADVLQSAVCTLARAWEQNGIYQLTSTEKIVVTAEGVVRGISSRIVA